MVGLRRKKIHRTRLERHQRASARAALYASLVLVGVSAVLLVGYLREPLDLSREQAWAEIDYAAQPAVRMLADYIRIDTSVDGDEVAGAEYLAARLASVGIPAHIERLGERRANLWAVLEGDDPRAVVLHHHIDVEPIFHPERWTRPPFGGEIQLPWIFGRGAFDMKSLAIAQLVALMELKESGKRPARSVIYLATSGEEEGSDLGTRHILREHPELVERFWAVLTEGGAVEATSLQSVKYWSTEVGQKRYAQLEACADSLEQLLALAQDVNRTGLPLHDLRVLPIVETFLRGYAPTRDREDLRRQLAHPRRLVRDLAAFQDLPVYIQAMFRDEVRPGQIRPAAGGGYEMSLHFSLMPDSDLDRVRRELVPDALLFGMSHHMVYRESARAISPTDHPVFRAVLEVLGDYHPEAPAGPSFLPWTATDSRFFRLAGIPSYGFSPFLILTPDTLTMASWDEKIALPGFLEGVRIYTDLLDRLTDPIVNP